MESIQQVANIIHFNASWKILVIPLILMGLDILTGFINAWKGKEIDSSKLRDGIVHKFGEMIIIILSLFLQYSLGLPKEISTFIAIYIVIMECISILENCEKLGVKIPKWLKGRLKKVVEEGEEEE